MKNKLQLFCLILVASLNLFSKNPSTPTYSTNYNANNAKRIINTSDSLIFDLANATLTATYIDVPIYIVSDDVIFGFDYEMQFNYAKLTFSTTIDLPPDDPNVFTLSYFNPNDLFLRYTSTTLLEFPSTGGIYVTKIRFAINTVCTAISAADFTNITAVLNGDPCAYRVSNFNLAQFVPTAKIYNAPTCLNTAVLFTDSSSISSGNITSRFWNFGNGRISNLQNELTTYTVAGTTAATLIVLASTGCGDTIVKPLTVGEVPVPSFSYTYSCVKDSVFFTNTSTIPSGTINSFEWDFGDLSAKSTVTNPSHRYLSGYYSAKLTATSNLSCSATSTNTPVSVNLTDFNKDGKTDIMDFLIFGPLFGTTCN